MKVITTPEMESVRNLSIESFLEIHGINHVALTKIAMSDVDETESLRNQARHEPLNHDTVKVYRHMALAGAVFPPLVVHQQNAGPFVIVDGNHRFQMMKLLGETDVAAYVVSGLDAAGFRDLAAAANVTNGQRLTMIEARNKAVDLHKRGESTKAIVTATGLTTSQVRDAINEAQVRDRTSNLSALRNVPATAVAKMNSIQSDVVLDAAIAAVVARSAGWNDVARLVSGVNAARSEAAQLETVEKWADDMVTLQKEKRRPRSKTKPFVAETRRFANGLLNIAPDVVKVQANGDSASLKELLYDTADHALKIADAL